jgi:hypothetical protein
MQNRMEKLVDKKSSGESDPGNVFLYFGATTNNKHYT